MPPIIIIFILFCGGDAKKGGIAKKVAINKTICFHSKTVLLVLVMGCLLVWHWTIIKINFSVLDYDKYKIIDKTFVFIQKQSYLFVTVAMYEFNLERNY